MIRSILMSLGALVVGVIAGILVATPTIDEPVPAPVPCPKRPADAEALWQAAHPDVWYRDAQRKEVRE